MKELNGTLFGSGRYPWGIKTEEEFQEFLKNNNNIKLDCKK